VGIPFRLNISLRGCLALDGGQLGRKSQAKKLGVGSIRANVLGRGLPHAAIVLGLLADVPSRIAIWTIALSWMGTACILNARRCGRTHCWFTGPYLAMIIPVLALGWGIVSFGLYGWLALAVLDCALEQNHLVGDRARVG
jgi:hypothetical protein